MKKIRAGIRFAFFALFLIALILRISWIRLWSGIDMRRFLTIRQRWTRDYLLPALGVRVFSTGTPPDFPCIVMSNHRSYLDPAILCSAILGYPVSKAEVSKWPLLGAGARLTGILFLKRESHKSRKHTLNAIEAKVKEGFPVILFPEGTTHQLPHTAPLKRGAFQLAADHGFSIVPVTLEYRNQEDYWIGDDTFVPHFFSRFGEKNMDVRVRYGSVISGENAQELLGKTQTWMDEQILELRREFL